MAIFGLSEPSPWWELCWGWWSEPKSNIPRLAEWSLEMRRELLKLPESWPMPISSGISSQWFPKSLVCSLKKRFCSEHFRTIRYTPTLRPHKYNLDLQKFHKFCTFGLLYCWAVLNVPPQIERSQPKAKWPFHTVVFKVTKNHWAEAATLACHRDVSHR